MSRVIRASPTAVYDFAADVGNLPLWAAGLARSKPVQDGAEVIFTLRQLGTSDEEFARDIQMVEADLDRLEDLMRNLPRKGSAAEHQR